MRELAARAAYLGLALPPSYSASVRVASKIGDPERLLSAAEMRAGFDDTIAPRATRPDAERLAPFARLGDRVFACFDRSTHADDGELAVVEWSDGIVQPARAQLRRVARPGRRRAARRRSRARPTCRRRLSDLLVELGFSFDDPIVGRLETGDTEAVEELLGQARTREVRGDVDRLFDSSGKASLTLNLDEFTLAVALRTGHLRLRGRRTSSAGCGASATRTSSSDAASTERCRGPTSHPDARARSAAGAARAAARAARRHARGRVPARDATPRSAPRAGAPPTTSTSSAAPARRASARRASCSTSSRAQIRERALARRAAERPVRRHRRHRCGASRTAARRPLRRRRRPRLPAQPPDAAAGRGGTASAAPGRSRPRLGRGRAARVRRRARSCPSSRDAELDEHETVVAAEPRRASRISMLVCGDAMGAVARFDAAQRSGSPSPRATSSRGSSSTSTCGAASASSSRAAARSGASTRARRGRSSGTRARPRSSATAARRGPLYAVRGLRRRRPARERRRRHRRRRRRAHLPRGDRLARARPPRPRRRRQRHGGRRQRHLGREARRARRGPAPPRGRRARAARTRGSGPTGLTHPTRETRFGSSTLATGDKRFRTMAAGRDSAAERRAWTAQARRPRVRRRARRFGPRGRVHRCRLGNGLRVLVLVDASAPVVELLHLVPRRLAPREARQDGARAPLRAPHVQRDREPARPASSTASSRRTAPSRTRRRGSTGPTTTSRSPQDRFDARREARGRAHGAPRPARAAGREREGGRRQRAPLSASTTTSRARRTSSSTRPRSRSTPTAGRRSAGWRTSRASRPRTASRSTRRTTRRTTRRSSSSATCASSDVLARIRDAYGALPALDDPDGGHRSPSRRRSRRATSRSTQADRDREARCSPTTAPRSATPITRR